MTLTIKLDGNWNRFQLASSTHPLCVPNNAPVPSARIPKCANVTLQRTAQCNNCVRVLLGAALPDSKTVRCVTPRLQRDVPKTRRDPLDNTSLKQPKAATIAYIVIAQMIMRVDNELINTPRKLRREYSSGLLFCSLARLRHRPALAV